MPCQKHKKPTEHAPPLGTEPPGTRRLASPLLASTRVTHLLFSLATKARTRHDEGVRTRWGARMDAVTTIRRTRTRTPPRRRRSTLSRRRLTVGSRRKQAAATPDRPQLRPRSPRATTTAGCPPAPAARDMPDAGGGFPSPRFGTRYSARDRLAAVDPAGRAARKPGRWRGARMHCQPERTHGARRCTHTKPCRAGCRLAAVFKYRG